MPENVATTARPVPHTHLSRRVFGVGAMMTAVEWQVTGNTIIVEDMTLTGRLFVRFNDLNSESIALHQVNKIVFTVPFWRLFFDAPAQPTGLFTIIVGTGLELHERPLKVELAELAARVGSINTFDRRGEIVWMDDFEDNINKWFVEISGTGASVALSTETALYGARSAKLTTGNAVGNLSQITRHQHISIDTLIGFEVSFAGIPFNCEYHFRVLISMGTHIASTALRFIVPPRTLSLWTRAGDWHVIASGLNVFTSPHSFSTIKIVYDVPNRRYYRVHFNNLIFDISAHRFFEEAAANMPCIIPSIQFATRTAMNLSTYIDNVIITRNEPP